LYINIYLHKMTLKNALAAVRRIGIKFVVDIPNVSGYLTAYARGRQLSAARSTSSKASVTFCHLSRVTSQMLRLAFE
jgi:hypothetical protein